MLGVQKQVENAICGKLILIKSKNNKNLGEKQMLAIKKIFEAIISPCVAVAVLIDESKRINEDGTWDEYHARKNRKAK